MPDTVEAFSLRGHGIAFDFDGGQWIYKDTGAPTVGNDRPCGYCGRGRTATGHDGCLGTLPGVRNACCGHGIMDEAYIQLSSGTRVAGADVAAKIRELRR